MRAPYVTPSGKPSAPGVLQTGLPSTHFYSLNSTRVATPLISSLPSAQRSFTNLNSSRGPKVLVKLTQLPKKTELYLRIMDITAIQRNPDNLMETIVSVNIMTPKGPLGHLVADSPDQIAAQMSAGGYNKVTQ